MAACEFPITFHQEVEDLIERFRTAIIVKQGTFTGDGTSGRFSIPSSVGMVEGTYTVEDSVFHFKLYTQPTELTCHRIENTFRSLIGMPSDTSLDFC